MKEQLKNRTLNLVINSKGGIGKTAIAKIISEYFRYEGINHIVIDTDEANSWLQSSKYYKVIPQHLIGNEGLISPEKIPDIIAENSDAENILVDTGANTYQPWYLFIKDNIGREIIEAYGFKLIIHIPVVPGQMFQECMDCVEEVCAADPGLTVAVWLNNGYKSSSSPITYDDFKYSISYELKKNIKHIIELPTCDPIRRRVLDNINNGYYSMSEIADASPKELQKFTLGGRPASIGDKLLIKMYRDLIFQAIKNSKEKLFVFKEVKDHLNELIEINKTLAGD